MPGLTPMLTCRRPANPADIELLHQVVTLGQEILPNLPKRERLPTTALFRAADVVFPRHGLDPDGEDKLSRIIFLVGGMRSTDNLLDRFRTVLGRMGIELEYVDHPTTNDGDSHTSAGPSQPPSPAARPAHAGRRRSSHHSSHHPHIHASPLSPRSPSPPPATDFTVDSGALSLSPAHHDSNGRRRRNSDSNVQLPTAARESQNPAPRQVRRQRSGSLEPPLLNFKEHFGQADEREPLPPTRASHTSRTIDPWLSQIPQYLPGAEPAELSREEDGLGTEEEEDDSPEASYGHDRQGMPMADEYTRSLELLRPAPDLWRKPGHLADAHDASHLSHAHNYQHHKSLPFRPRPVAHRPALRPAPSFTGPQSPQSHMSSLATDYEGFQNASDTTMQEDLGGGPQPRVDPHIMAKVADTYFMRFAFLGGLAVDMWRTICRAHQEQQHYAAQMDRELSTSEALLVWGEAAGIPMEELAGRTRQLQALREEQAIDGRERADDDGKVADAEHVDDAGDANEDDEEEAAEQLRQMQDEREKRMRRAARVYTITTMFNAVSHWQAMAQEEANRTKIARRHLLRRKVFDAWRTQTDRDNATATCLTLGWTVHRWTAALHQVHEENARLAVHFYERDLTTVAFFAWFRLHQERAAVSWRAEQAKKRAVEAWHEASIATANSTENAASMARQVLLGTTASRLIEETQGQVLVLLRIREQEAGTYMRAAFKDWAKQALYQSQLRVVQATNEVKIKQASLRIWRRSAAEAQDRAAQLDLDIAEEYVVHWNRETRLALFRADREDDLKVDAVTSWVLAEKLAFLLRYRDEQLLRKTCGAMKAAFSSRQMGQDREDELVWMAERLDESRAFSQLVSAFDEQSGEYGVAAETATFIDRGALAAKSLGCWKHAVADHDDMETTSRRGAFYVGVTNALDGWPKYAQDVRVERLRSTYRSFRRAVKRQVAADCVAIWHAATAQQGNEAHGDSSYDTARQLHHEHEADTLFAMLNTWILQTNNCLFQQSVAAEADAEVYLSRWRLLLADCEELGGAAAEHDTVTLLAGRWDGWELQAVQARARQHTATELHEKNDRRLGRRVLGVWQTELASQLHGSSLGPDDLRASYATSSEPPPWPGSGEEGGDGDGRGGFGTSTSMWRLARASFSSPLAARSAAPLFSYRPPPRNSHDGREDGPAARPASFLMHPISETPMSTATQPFLGRGGRDRARGGGIGEGGSFSVPAPGNSAATSAAVTSAGQQLGQLRRLHLSAAAAAAPYRPQPQHPAPQHSSLQAQQSTAAAAAPSTTPARESHRHRLLQRHLQSAAQLAESVQLGPMSDFDAGDELGGATVVAGGDMTEVDDLRLGDYTDVSSEDGNDLLGHPGDDSMLTAPHRHLPSVSRLHRQPSAATPRRFNLHPTPPVPASAQPIAPHLLHGRRRLAGNRPAAYSVDSSLAPATVAEDDVPRPPRPRFLDSTRARARDRAPWASTPGGFARSIAATTTPVGLPPSGYEFDRRIEARFAHTEGGEGYAEDAEDGDYASPLRRLPDVTLLRRRLPLSTSSAAATAWPPSSPQAPRTRQRVTFVDAEPEGSD